MPPSNELKLYCIISIIIIIGAIDNCLKQIVYYYYFMMHTNRH